MFAVFLWEVKNRAKETHKLQQHYSIHPTYLGHNPKAALKHTAKTVAAINSLARSVPVWKEIPLWGYKNRGYDYMAFIDATLVKSEGFLSSTSRRWFYMLNQPKSRWQGPTEAHLHTPFVFSH